MNWPLPAGRRLAGLPLGAGARLLLVFVHAKYQPSKYCPGPRSP